MSGARRHNRRPARQERSNVGKPKAGKQQRLATTVLRQREQRVRWGAIAAALVAVGVIAWLGLGRITQNVDAPAALPGPEGGPRIAQDVGTLVGQPAPAFTLADAEGTSYTVTPGEGRPLVLVSHMGIT